MIMHSKAWTGNSAIFIVADEADFDGTQPGNDDWADTSGCCDSPYLPANVYLTDAQREPSSSSRGVFGGGRHPLDDTTYGRSRLREHTPYSPLALRHRRQLRHQFSTSATEATRPDVQSRYPISFTALGMPARAAPARRPAAGAATLIWLD